MQVLEQRIQTECVRTILAYWSINGRKVLKSLTCEMHACERSVPCKRCMPPSDVPEWYRYRSTPDGSSEKLDPDDRIFLFPSEKLCFETAMNIHPDLFGDYLSSVISTETLLAHDLVPEGLAASSKGGLRSSRCKEEPSE